MGVGEGGMHFWRDLGEGAGMPFGVFLGGEGVPFVRSFERRGGCRWEVLLGAEGDGENGNERGRA